MDPVLIVTVALAAVGCLDQVKDFYKPTVTFQNHHYQKSQDKIRVTSELSEVLRPRDGRAEEQNVHWSSIANSVAHIEQMMQEANVLHQQRNEIEQRRSRFWRAMVILNQVYAVFKIISYISFKAPDFSDFTFSLVRPSYSFVLHISTSLIGAVVLYVLYRDPEQILIYAAFWAGCNSVAFLSFVSPLYPGFIGYILTCLVICLLVTIARVIIQDKLKPEVFLGFIILFSSFCPFFIFFYILFTY